MIVKERHLLLLIIFALLTGCSFAPQAADYDALPALKILAEAPGMYEIDARDLEPLGWNVESIDLDQIRILNRGRERPFWLEGQGKELKLHFYAQQTHSRYTRQNVYWLVDQRYHGEDSVNSFYPAEPSTAGTPDAGFALPNALEANRYTASFQLEENLIYAPQVEDFDPWFWLSMPAPFTREFEFELSEVSTGPGGVLIEVWASTQASESPDHHLRVTLNERQIADEFWDGKGLKFVQTEVPEGILKSGVNILQIESPGDTGVTADIALLNRVAFAYPRYTVAQEDRLSFAGSGTTMVLTGFSGPVDGYDVTDPESVLPVELVNNNDSRLELQSQLDHHYLVVGPKGYLGPQALLKPTLIPNLSAPGQAADYIAIGPRDLLDSLQPLLDQRASQGLEVVAVTDEAIYDQFNHGFPEPEAIRNFLRYASEKWEVGPRYVLLLGDSTYDSKGYLGESEANRLPVYFVDTVYGGQTASDVIFTQLDEDDWPDIALGRVPAQTPRQVEIWVQKLLQNEQASQAEDWNQRILAVADGQEVSFQKDAQRFLDRFPENFTKSLVHPIAGATGTNTEIKQRLESGNLLVAYFGHGSVQMWGKDRLFSTQDVAGLSNQGRYPLMVNMTCLTGLFTHPKVESLTEALLWQPNGGAVAVLAPTSLTLPNDQSFLSDALVEALFADPDNSIGEALLAARRAVPADTAGIRDVMDTFLLFGDPAMKLPLP